MKERSRTKAQLAEELAALRRQMDRMQDQEKEHQLARRYLENVLDNSPDAIGIVDRKGRFIKWNRMAEELFGYSIEELRGKSSFDLYANGVLLDGMLSELRARGSVKNYEIDMKRRDGSLIPVELSISLLRDAEGGLVGSVCVARDLSDLKKALHIQEQTNARLQQEIGERRRTLEALKESQAEYRAIFENTGNATVIIEEDTTISLANTEFVKLSGYSREEIEGKKSWTEFFSEKDLASMKEYHRLRRIDPHAAPRNYEASFRDRQGKTGDVYLTVATIASTKKSVISFLDITDRKQMEQALKQSNRELEQQSLELSQLNEMLDLLQVCNSVEEIAATIGHYAAKLFPLDAGFLSLFDDTKSAFSLVTRWGELDLEGEEFGSEDCWALRRGTVHVVEEPGNGLICRHLHRSATPSAYLCVPMTAQGRVMGLFHLQRSIALKDGLSEDAKSRPMSSRERLARAVTDHIALALANLDLRETLRQQSIRDPLTGLYNRRFMEESLQRELARASRNETPLGIIMLDVDHFKRFNDTYGHEAGDLLLTQLGSFLKAHVREEDVACRYGGEEFVLILPGVSLEIAVQRAEHLRDRLKRVSVQYQGKPLDTVTISMGVAALSDRCSTSAAILNSADSALYHAKAAGRDRIKAAQSA